MQGPSDYDKITQLIIEYSDLTEEQLMQLPAQLALILTYHIIEHETYLTLDDIDTIKKHYSKPQPKLPSLLIPVEIHNN